MKSFVFKTGDEAWASINKMFIEQDEKLIHDVKEVVSQIEKIEQKIEENKNILESGKMRKQEVLKKYLQF